MILYLIILLQNKIFQWIWGCLSNIVFFFSLPSNSQLFFRGSCEYGILTTIPLSRHISLKQQFVKPEYYIPSPWILHLHMAQANPIRVLLQAFVSNAGNDTFSFFHGIKVKTYNLGSVSSKLSTKREVSLKMKPVVRVAIINQVSCSIGEPLIEDLLETNLCMYQCLSQHILQLFNEFV